MTEETAGAETPADGEAIAVPVETHSEATTEQPVTDTTAEPADQEAGDDTPAAPRKKHWAHERIDELTRQRREAERTAEYWKARAGQTVDVESLDYEEQIAERVSSRNRREMAESAVHAVQSVSQQVFDARATITRERYADYDTVIGNPNLAITTSMAEVIMDSETGPELAYHLGKNPAEAARIASLPAIRQAAELGRLEAKLTAPKSLPKQPPAPVQPVGGNASGGSLDPAKMSMAEYAAARKAGKI